MNLRNPVDFATVSHDRSRNALVVGFEASVRSQTEPHDQAGQRAESHADKYSGFRRYNMNGEFVGAHAAAPERAKSALVSDASSFLAGPRGF